MSSSSRAASASRGAALRRVLLLDGGGVGEHRACERAAGGARGAVERVHAVHSSAFTAHARSWARKLVVVQTRKFGERDGAPPPRGAGLGPLPVLVPLGPAGRRALVRRPRRRHRVGARPRSARRCSRRSTRTRRPRASTASSTATRSRTPSSAPSPPGPPTTTSSTSRTCRPSARRSATAARVRWRNFSWHFSNFSWHFCCAVVAISPVVATTGAAAAAVISNSSLSSRRRPLAAPSRARARPAHLRNSHDVEEPPRAGQNCGGHRARVAARGDEDAHALQGPLVGVADGRPPRDRDVGPHGGALPRDAALAGHLRLADRRGVEGVVLRARRDRHRPRDAARRARRPRLDAAVGGGGERHRVQQVAAHDRRPVEHGERRADDLGGRRAREEGDGQVPLRARPPAQPRLLLLPAHAQGAQAARAAGEPRLEQQGRRQDRGRGARTPRPRPVRAAAWQRGRARARRATPRPPPSALPLRSSAR